MAKDAEATADLQRKREAEKILWLKLDARDADATRTSRFLSKEEKAKTKANLNGQNSSNRTSEIQAQRSAERNNDGRT